MNCLVSAILIGVPHAISLLVPRKFVAGRDCLFSYTTPAAELERVLGFVGATTDCLVGYIFPVIFFCSLAPGERDRSRSTAVQATYSLFSMFFQGSMWRPRKALVTALVACMTAINAVSVYVQLKQQ